MTDRAAVVCCFVAPHGEACPAPAEWRIRHGGELDEYTESCTAHVGALLTDAPEHRVYPVTAPLLEGVRPQERAAARRLLQAEARRRAKRN